MLIAVGSTEFGIRSLGSPAGLLLLRPGCLARSRQRLCYVRGPEGIMVALAEQLS